MDAATARDLILSAFPSEEYDHFCKPAYRIPARKKDGRPGRTFLTLWLNEGHAVLMLTKDQQTELMDEHPDVFEAHPSKWGEKGSTIAHLQRMDERLFLKAVKIAHGHASR